MQKYEYMLYTLLVPIGQVQEEITKMAQGGWRLVAVNGQNGVHYFERLLTPDAADGACTCTEFVQSVFDPNRCAVCRRPRR
jgi:hypothetical protein